MTTNLFRRPTKERNLFNARGGAGARSRFTPRTSSITNAMPQQPTAGGGGRVGGALGALRTSGSGSPRSKQQVFGTGSTASLGSTTSIEGQDSPIQGGGAKMLRGLTGTVDQLREGAELNQAQMRAMFDRMCALSAEVDSLKGQLK